MKRDSDQATPVEAEPGFSRRTMVAGSLGTIAASIAGTVVGRAATVVDAPAATVVSARAGTVKAPKEYRPLALGIDYATTDSAYYDPDLPSMHFPHVFPSQGTPIQSFMWLASGEGAKGCVILSPQAYGGDSLDSLVPALVGAGINVMRFNPRGMWDDKHVYSFIGQLEDLHAAVAFLRQNGGQHMVPPGTGYEFPRPFQIDIDRIAVLGKSGGGGMIGWTAASESPDLNTVIAVTPSELLHLPLSGRWEKMMIDLKKSTAGRIDILRMLRVLSPADYARCDMPKAAPRLVNKNVLLIGSSYDPDYLENIHRPLVKSMRDAGAKNFAEAILSANDYYLTARIALTRLVVTWLKTECGF